MIPSFFNARPLYVAGFETPLGFQNPLPFKPYLNEFAERLTHQYRLTFLATEQKKTTYQTIKLTTEVDNAELVAQDKVCVPAAK